MLWLVLARVALPRPVADDGIQHLNDPAPTPRAFVFDRSARGDGTLRCPKCGTSPDGKSNCCSEGGTWQGQCTLTLADGGQHTWSDGYDVCDDSIAEVRAVFAAQDVSETGSLDGDELSVDCGGGFCDPWRVFKHPTKGLYEGVEFHL